MVSTVITEHVCDRCHKLYRVAGIDTSNLPTGWTKIYKHYYYNQTEAKKTEHNLCIDCSAIIIAALKPVESEVKL